MLEITRIRKTVALRKARTLVSELSDRQLIVMADKLERSNDPNDKVKSIAIRAVMSGDTEKTFAKACKVYKATTKEHVRISC